MQNFCTYFDINYLHRGLALYNYLEKTGEPFTLWILCFDEQTYDIINKLALPHVKSISEREFEKGDDSLVATKSKRTRVEYYWTSTPSLPLYIFRQDNSINLLIYLDADIFFYSSPKAITDELGDNSILIIPHDYSLEYEAHIEAGIYNVGIIAFRRDTNGIASLNWWRERCIEWCYSKYENGHIGDQTYLNDFPGKFEKVKVSSNIGINAAPWNVAKYGLKRDDKGNLFIAETSLVCFHFHAMKFSASWLAYIGTAKINIPTSILAIVYQPYIAALISARKQLIKNNYKIDFKTSGIPWRYIAGRLMRRKPVRHFMWV
jgi:hypothetical protein